MDDFHVLRSLSLINKVSQELEAHLGLSDKTLAEFVIDLAHKYTDPAKFGAALAHNGAEFPVSFATGLLTLIGKFTAEAHSEVIRDTTSNGIVTGKKFPGLSSSNDSAERRATLEQDALGCCAVADPAVPDRLRSVPNPSHLAGNDRAPDVCPVPGKVYPGKVSNVLDFGCFVQIEGLWGVAEGLVHVSLLGNSVARTPHSAFKRGQPCYVKVLTFHHRPPTLCVFALSLACSRR